MATLYVIGTPIGNLDDITLRAISTLKIVDLILCEDTRVTKRLLDKYEINSKLKRLDANVESDISSDVKALFAEFESIALLTDAGTPAISDPGYRFVRAVREAGFNVVVIPGVSALTSAISISGLRMDEFVFLGFLPHKKGRETLFKEMVESKRAIVFYESTHRLMKTLEKLREYLGDGRRIAVAKELTKIHEELIVGSPSEVIEKFMGDEKKQKGEFVVMVECV
jgi:16S rRNA (cytidine1402-2'-O)-methyltransferase